MIPPLNYLDIISTSWRRARRNAHGNELCLSLLKLGTRSMALRRLLALAAAATVAADVVQAATVRRRCKA